MLLLLKQNLDSRSFPWQIMDKKGKGTKVQTRLNIIDLNYFLKKCNKN